MVNIEKLFGCTWKNANSIREYGARKWDYSNVQVVHPIRKPLLKKAQKQLVYNGGRFVMALSGKEQLDKIQGSLIGGAIGDALGYPVEFLSLDSIKERYGTSGITKYELDQNSGTAVISDDTQMTLFTAAGLLVHRTRLGTKDFDGDPTGDVFRSYLNWMETQGYHYTDSQKISLLSDVKELHAQRAPGNTCLSALSERHYNGEYATIGNPINNSKGCGGVMRVAPVGLFYRSISIDRIDRIAADIAAITHSHPLGYIPAAMLAHIVNRCVYGDLTDDCDLLSIVKEALVAMKELYPDEPYVEDLISLISRAVSCAKNNKTDEENTSDLGQGWVAEEALAIAIYCSFKYENDFTKAMIAAVNHDGDSDSTGAITGNILGSLIGYSAIPDEWKTGLELKDVIIDIATDIARCSANADSGFLDDPKWLAKYARS